MRRSGRCWILALGLLVSGCTRRPAGPARVAISLFPVYDIGRRIAGERLAVDLMLPPGMFDHHFEPRAQDFARVADARLVVLVGLGLDRWGRKLASGSPEAQVLEIAPLLDPLPIAEGGEHEEAEGEKSDGRDPHVWLDPVRMQKATDVLVDAYSRLDPGGADGFRRRGESLKASLSALHADIDRRMRVLPKKSIVTFHGSWNYFAQRYGLVVAAVVEPFPGQEPTPSYVRDVVRTIKAKHVAALFSEPQLSRRAAEVIAREAGVPLFELDPIGGTPGRDSYEALLRYNLDVLKKALR